MKDEDIVNIVKSIRARIKNNINHPHELVDLAIEVTTANSYLGDVLGEYKLAYEKKRGELYGKYIAEGKAATLAENLVRSELSNLRGNITKLELLHKDVERIVSIIQTKVRVLEGETKNKF